MLRTARALVGDYCYRVINRATVVLRSFMSYRASIEVRHSDRKAG